MDPVWLIAALSELSLSAATMILVNAPARSSPSRHRAFRIWQPLLPAAVLVLHVNDVIYRCNVRQIPGPVDQAFVTTHAPQDRPEQPVLVIRHPGPLGYPGATRPLHDLLQPVCPAAKGRRVGSTSRSGFRRLRERYRHDRLPLCPCPQHGATGGTGDDGGMGRSRGGRTSKSAANRDVVPFRT